MSETEPIIKPSKVSPTQEEQKRRQDEEIEVIFFTPRKGSTVTSGRYRFESKLSKRKSKIQK